VNVTRRMPCVRTSFRSRNRLLNISRIAGKAGQLAKGMIEAMKAGAALRFKPF